MSPAIIQKPFSPLRIAFTTSFTPRRTNFAFDALRINLYNFLVVFFDANGCDILLTNCIYKNINL